MPTIVTTGDRLLTTGGQPSWLKRPSVPLSAYAGGSALGLAGGLSISYAQLYRTQPWVAVAINKLVRQMSRLPLKVYKRRSDGEKERATDGPAPLFEQPWKRGSPNKLKQAFSFPVFLHGNSLIAKSRPAKGAPPDSLIPLDWRFIKPGADSFGNPVDYWSTTQFGGEERFIAPDEVVHTAWWAPDGPIGVSPLQQLGVSIRLEEAAQRYQTSAFENGVRTAGALVLPPDSKLKREEREELRQEIHDTHGGVDQAFRLMLLSGGMDFKGMSQTAVEAELIEQRKLTREEVAAVYDIPPPLIGILDHATYSNVAEMHRMLYVTVLGPPLVMVEETIKAELIDPEPAWEGYFVEFDLSEVLKGDTLKEIQALREAIQTGLMTPNEGRQVRNLGKSDNPAADQLYMPANNMAPLGDSGADSGASEADLGAQQAFQAHLRRVQASVLSKVGAGNPDPFNAERFQRELEADLTPISNGGAAALAETCTRTLAEAIASADGDSARLKTIFQALGA